MQNTTSDYCECLVKGGINLKAVIGTILSGLAALLLLALSFLYVTEPFGLVAGPFAAVFAILAVFLGRRIRVEYEYCCTAEGIDIDVIYGQNKRKRAVSVSTDSIITVGPETNETIRAQLRSLRSVSDYAGKAKADRYLILCTSGEHRIGYRISPNEKMLRFIRLRMRRELLTK